MDSEGQNPDFDERRRGGNDFDPSLYNGSGSDSAWGNKMRSDAAGGPADGFDDRRENAKDFARFGEEGAAKTGSAAGQNGVGNSPFSSALSNTRDAEKRGGFANNVKGKTLEQAAGAAMPGGKKALAQVKKFGPLGGILAMIATLVMIFAGTQSLAPFGLIANGLDQFNNLRTSMNKRSTYFNRFMLDKSRNHSITSKAPIFGSEKFKVSNSLSKKLQKNGITYIDGDTRFLVYTDPTTGKTYGVAANDNDVGSIPRTAEIPDGNGGMKTVDIDEIMNIDDVMKTSGNFKSSLDKGTRTLKGHVAGWFDELSDLFHLKRIFNSRDRFKDTSDVASDDEIMGKARTGGMSEDIRPDSTDADVLEEKVSEEPNEDGTYEEIKYADPATGEDELDLEGVKKESTRGLSPDSDDVQDAISNSMTKKTKSIVAGVGKVANYGCMAMKVIAAMNMAMSAIHIANVLNYVTGFLEAVQRTQAGDAGENELSYYMTRLSAKGNTEDSYGNIVSEDKSSLESNAWNQFFSSGAVVVQANDPIAEKYNKEYVGAHSIANIMNMDGKGAGDDSDGGTTVWGTRMLNDIMSLGSVPAAYKACLYANATEAILEMGTFLINFFTGPAGWIKQGFKELTDIAKRLLKRLSVGLITSALMAVFMASIPHLARLMTMDLIKGMAGQDAAYAINSGFNAYLGTQMQLSSGLPATEEALMAHNRLQQEVIASEAEYERSQRSPFDPTSKYTFIGSIVNSLMPIANTWSSPLMIMSKTMNTVGVAFSNVLPTAKADGEVRFETSVKTDCQNLQQIGLVGDAYCNPYFVTDTSTIAEDPAEVFAIVDGDTEGEEDLLGMTDSDENENFTEDEDGDGNPEINKKSKLGKWVIACASRDSQFGIVDNNVMGNLAMINTGSQTLDTILGTGVSMIPFVGDYVDLKDSMAELKNFEWATGENCISEKYKYYSRYAEDQRLMESAGIIEESAVAKLLKEYYEENPIDNSYEGIIARYSGMTKEQVAEMFDDMEILEWVANYNPKEYGPEKYEDNKKEYRFNSNETISSAEVVLLNTVSYEDLRIKTKIA